MAVTTRPLLVGNNANLFAQKPDVKWGVSISALGVVHGAKKVLSCSDWAK